jgi:hypothetical protein
MKKEKVSDVKRSELVSKRQAMIQYAMSRIVLLIMGPPPHHIILQ